MVPDGMAHWLSAPVVAETQAADCRLTPFISVKMPPTSVCPSAASASDRTVSLAWASNVWSMAPSAKKAATRLYAFPPARWNAPPA